VCIQLFLQLLTFVPVVGGLLDAAFFCDVDGFEAFLLLVGVILECLDGDWREYQDDGDVHEDHEALAKVCAVPGERYAVGSVVVHKTFGTGAVSRISKDRKYIFVKFEGSKKKGEEKQFVFTTVFEQGFLKLKKG